MEFQGKTALISGAASGIGYEMSKQLIAKGVKVFCIDIADCSQPLSGVTYLEADITNPSDLQAAFSQISGPIHILHNNAGVMRRGLFYEATPEDYDFIMGINVKGSWLMLKYAYPLLAPDATILQMSSRHGSTVKPTPALYALSKFAVIGLADIVKKTVPAFRVKVAYPGPVDTPLVWVGVKEEDKAAKRKMMVTVEQIVNKLIELMESDKEKLLFDEVTFGYHME